jgi:hypothetical protein
MAHARSSIVEPWRTVRMALGREAEVIGNGMVKWCGGSGAEYQVR